jgi:hypothetical protein
MARWDPKQAFKFAQMKRQLALIVIALDQMSNAQQPLRGCAVANAGPSVSPYARAIELRRTHATPRSLATAMGFKSWKPQIHCVPAAKTKTAARRAAVMWSLDRRL